MKLYSSFSTLVLLAVFLSGCSSFALGPTQTPTPLPTKTPQPTKIVRRTVIPRLAPAVLTEEAGNTTKTIGQMTLESIADTLELRWEDWVIEPQTIGPHEGGFFPERPVSTFAVTRAVWDGNELRGLFEIWVFENTHDAGSYASQLTAKLDPISNPEYSITQPDPFWAVRTRCDANTSPVANRPCETHTIAGDDKHGVVVHVVFWGLDKTSTFQIASELLLQIMEKILGLGK